MHDTNYHLCFRLVNVSGGWMSTETPARGVPGPLTSTAVKRPRQADSESEAGTEADFEQ